MNRKTIQTGFGQKEKLQDSCLYCEEVIKSGNKLLVPNALED